MKIKFQASIEVDLERFCESTGYEIELPQDKKLLKQLIENEFEWVRRSGIKITKLISK